MPARSFTDYPGHFIDVMPTLAEVGGAQYPSKFNEQPIHPVAGESLMPVLRGEKTKRSKPLYFQWGPRAGGAADDWKIVSGAESGRRRGAVGTVQPCRGQD